MKKPRAKAGKRPPRRSGRKAQDPLANIPNKDSIVATETLIAPGGRRFTILETDQTDPYDRPARKRR